MSDCKCHCHHQLLLSNPPKNASDFCNTCLCSAMRRLEKLENQARMRENFCQKIQEDFNELQKSYCNLVSNKPGYLSYIEERLSKLEKTLNELVDKIAEIANYMYREK